MLFLATDIADPSGLRGYFPFWSRTFHHDLASFPNELETVMMIVRLSNRPKHRFMSLVPFSLAWASAVC